jgi:hypothetical protein
MPTADWSVEVSIMSKAIRPFASQAGHLPQSVITNITNFQPPEEEGHFPLDGLVAIMNSWT